MVESPWWSAGENTIKKVQVTKVTIIPFKAFHKHVSPPKSESSHILEGQMCKSAPCYV